MCDELHSNTVATREIVRTRHTLEASVLVRQAACSCHILHSPQVYAAIAAATGNTLPIFTSCAAGDLATCTQKREVSAYTSIASDRAASAMQVG